MPDPTPDPTPHTPDTHHEVGPLDDLAGDGHTSREDAGDDTRTGDARRDTAAGRDAIPEDEEAPEEGGGSQTARAFGSGS